MNLLNLRMIYKELDNLFGILNMSVQSQRKSLNTLEKKECVEG